jgi:hypothetical protein
MQADQRNDDLQRLPGVGIVVLGMQLQPLHGLGTHRLIKQLGITVFEHTRADHSPVALQWHSWWLPWQPPVIPGRTPASTTGSGSGFQCLVPRSMAGTSTPDAVAQLTNGRHDSAPHGYCGSDSAAPCPARVLPVTDFQQVHRHVLRKLLDHRPAAGQECLVGGMVSLASFMQVNSSWSTTRLL